MGVIESRLFVIGISSALHCGPADSPNPQFAAITARTPPPNRPFGQVVTAPARQAPPSRSV
ncbi:hypothetical protein FEZ60_13170 [Rhodococcus sp. MS16]|nr:hypothetical protein [Rhodococcus sp. MS16]RZL21308.1 MAG: hypothetical protein EOP31_28410 [Rhodococcus sp. (in: high G+C Gram-positive bacteria)]